MAASSPPMEQAINIAAEPEFQTPLTTKITLESTVRFYERLVVKVSRPLVETPLSCDEHPFFANLPNVPQ